MALPIYRLRLLLAVTAALLTLVVAGMYLYARLRSLDVRNRIPDKIGYDIKQTANGFQFSKSDGKRTLFSVQASDVKEFKLNGRAELHNVSIILYGRDSSRYDRISGEDFAFDPKTGEVTAKGEVQIDLLANPEGLGSPDQSAPRELKNTIHLKTSGLVFNRDTGDAFTDARVEFSIPQARGWAQGVKYAGKSNFLTLSSHIHVELNGANAAVIEAERGVITNEPREIQLDHPHLDREGATLQADRATFHLGPGDFLQSMTASGEVTTRIRQAAKPGMSGPVPEIQSRADEAELLFMGSQSLLQTATLTGNVQVEQTGPQPLRGDAGLMIFQFTGENQLRTVRAADRARLSQDAAPGTTGAQNVELTAPIIDFILTGSNSLERAETSGAAKITFTPSQDSPAPAAAQTTVVTAARFEARFAADHGKTYATTVHGAPGARVVNSVSSQPDRISTSDSIDADFLPQGGIQSIRQQGNVIYSDSQPPDKRTQAWATTAVYSPADEMLVLTGNPRVTTAAMATTAKTIRINRATGQATAETDVKSTYSELREHPDGALLASASPIHVTARTMTAQNNPGVALYTGNARLWQDANVIEAPSIQFDRDRRSVTALGTPPHPVLTTLIQPEKGKAAGQNSTAKGPQGPTSTDNSTPITITARQFTYTDSERKARYEGGVLARGSDFTASSKTLDAYLQSRGQLQTNQPVAGPGRLEKMVALSDVVIQQARRRAEGQNLVYTVAEDKFVLTGGPPSIFDAEHGKITGVSLTFFRRDDRVLVEGEASTPVVTQTRVAR